MALTNILREPRRELIEQGMGAIAVAGLLIVNLSIAAAMCLIVDGTVFVPLREFAAADLLGIFATVLFVAAAVAMHAIGEGICDAMARRGNDPRPTQRL